ncbi:MAG: GNAT family N-acetyltransferase [Rhodoferax sp.]|uniref:GNAT family N-acetyltransferase n=1 Tax=Rhodoferax sp. TaxID=50421 RepID=UPI002615E119|nr:GNAT family N-acetyltransferase [Rhodoferax sp.]MDD5333045.1 GNAT family N-acetyltransferase [Rhodoferax sp.]
MDAIAHRKIVIRALAKEDLDAVVAIDAEIEGHARRDYIERRLAAALREPALHAQFAALEGDQLVGYLLARLLVGEFGRPHPGLRLEIVGVHHQARGIGVGAQLLQALLSHARKHGLSELHTSAAWNDHAMLRWFDAMDFTLAPERWLDCQVDGGAYHAGRDEAVEAPDGFGPGHEIDYGAPGDNDFEKLARDSADVQSMKPQDLQEIARIDRALTGRDRTDYMQAKLAEALNDSALRVSMTARLDGTIVGYLMARADLGDFGRTEPAAVIDTIGVDPEYEHRGVGRALLSQLFANLGALRVERVETLTAPRDQALLGFLFDAGFQPSQRLAFSHPI